MNGIGSAALRSTIGALHFGQAPADFGMIAAQCPQRLSAGAIVGGMGIVRLLWAHLWQL